MTLLQRTWVVSPVCGSNVLSKYTEDNYTKFDIPLRYNSSRISDYVSLHVYQFIGDRFRLGMVSTSHWSLFSSSIHFAIYLFNTDVGIYISAT